MAPLTIHNYRSDTGAFVSTTDARVIPSRESLPDGDITKWQIPAHATTVAPVAVAGDEVAVFTPGPDTWAAKADLIDRIVFSIASGFTVTYGGTLSDYDEAPFPADRPNLPPGSDLPADLSLIDVGFLAPFLTEQKAAKQQELLNEHENQRHLPINVTVSTGNDDFGALTLDIEGLDLVVTAIAAGITVSSPRSLQTVAGVVEPLTNQDYLDIWEALLDRADSLLTTLVTKQGEIDALPDPASVEAYDVTTGW